MNLADQVYPEGSISLYKAYKDANQESYGYLILVLEIVTNDGLRYRTHIFPTDTHPLTVYSDIVVEACEIELSHPPSAQDGRI